jgi:hypothetical protein
MTKWLKGKDRKFVEGLLGKKRADLFLKGRMSLTQLISHNQRPLSLDEIEARLRGDLVKGVPHKSKPHKSVFGLGGVHLIDDLAIIGGPKLVMTLANRFGNGGGSPSFLPLPASFPSRFGDNDSGGMASMDFLKSLFTFKEFDSRTKFGDYFESQGVQGAGSLWDGMGPAYAAHVGMEFGRLNHAFPELNVGRMEMRDLSGMSPNAWAMSEGGPGIPEGIYFDSTRFGSMTSMGDFDAQSASLFNRNGFWAGEGSWHPEGMLAHEFGHGVFQNLDRVAAPGVANAQGSMRSFLDSALPGLDLSSGVGQAGLSDVEELFSQSFAAIQWIPPSEWTDWHRAFHNHLISLIGNRPILNAAQIHYGQSYHPGRP